MLKKRQVRKALVKKPYDLGTAMRDLFLEETRFQRILNSIAQRKNLILQAPPPVSAKPSLPSGLHGV